MLVLGRTVRSLDDSPPRKVQLKGADGEPIQGVFALMRLLPKAESERILRPAMRKARAGDAEAAQEAINRWMLEHIKRALVNTEGGFGWVFDDEDSVKVYAAHLPGLEKGKGVDLDGKWTEAFKVQ